MLDHRFHFDGTHDEVIELDGLVGGAVAVYESVQDVVVQVVSGGRQSVTQFICIQPVRLVSVVQLENGLKENKIS